MFVDIIQEVYKSTWLKEASILKCQELGQGLCGIITVEKITSHFQGRLQLKNIHFNIVLCSLEYI